MPCSYYTPEQELRLEREKVDELTRLLCGACRLLDSHEAKMDLDLSVWWKAHQEIDRKRAADKAQRAAHEAAKATAAAKLSPEERKALGL